MWAWSCAVCAWLGQLGRGHPAVSTPPPRPVLGCAGLAARPNPLDVTTPGGAVLPVSPSPAFAFHLLFHACLWMPRGHGLRVSLVPWVR